MELCLAIGGVVAAFLVLLCFIYWYRKPAEREHRRRAISGDSGLDSHPVESVSVVHEQSRDRFYKTPFQPKKLFSDKYLNF
jgi:hypothetical protein